MESAEVDEAIFAGLLSAIYVGRSSEKVFRDQELIANRGRVATLMLRRTARTQVAAAGVAGYKLGKKRYLRTDREVHMGTT